MKFVLVSMLFLHAVIAAAQEKKLPDFGKVDKEELLMNACSFDKNAGAMMIFNEAESLFQINMQAMFSPVFQQTTHRVRIKIFNKNGFDEANIKIKYPASDRDVSVKNLSAQTYNLDASGNVVVTKLDKASVYDKKINSRYSEKIFAFPDVKEGSVIEYKYTLDGASENTWYFQKKIPVQFSRFILDMPVELRVSVIPNYSLPVKRITDNRSSGNYSSYTMENIPGLDDEPFMSNREDYLQRMEARITALDFPGQPVRSLVRTWPQVIRSLMEDEDFGRQLKKDIPRTADLDKLLQNETDSYKKMCIIHRYVRSNMQWNNYDNIWAFDGVKSAWKDKKGTSGEINLILINLLKDAKLNAAPLLVSTKENGLVNASFAEYGQFNKVLAYVEIGDKQYVLDAVEKNTPSYMLPADVMASEGLLIKKPDDFDWGWKVLWDDKHTMSTNTFLNAEIGSDGVMKGVATVTSADYRKLELLPVAKKGEKELQEILMTDPGISIDSFVVANAETDSLPLVETFKFTAPSSSSGGYTYFSCNYFSGLNKNPFLADERNTDVFFGANQQHYFNALVFIPEGYTIDELPKNITMIMPDTSIIFKRKISFEEGLLSVTIKIDHKKPFYTPEEYSPLKEFYKKMYALLDEKFVYRKKS